MKFSSRPSAWGLSVVSFFSVSPVTVAQDAEVLITAQRFSASIDTAPVNVTVLTEQDIDKSYWPG